MNLLKKKELAARTLHVGIERVAFNIERLDEIKEAITKQDIRDLIISGAIIVKQIKGRKSVVKRKTRRRVGSKKQIPKRRKKEYMALTRKLRKHLSNLKRTGRISDELFWKLRKEIRSRSFKSLFQMKEKIVGVKK